jgi:hypothetical protein
MSEKPEDGIYTFKAGETLPNWCSFSPGAKIERGSVKCYVRDGTVGEWDISNNTRIEGDYYLYAKGKEVSKIHIKEKRRITRENKPPRKKLTNKVAIYIFLGFAIVIFVISFIINNP